jgi:hypothetical protein
MSAAMKGPMQRTGDMASASAVKPAMTVTMASMGTRGVSAWLLAIALAGCAPTMPRADERFGLEVRALLAAQALAPTPSQPSTPSQSSSSSSSSSQPMTPPQPSMPSSTLPETRALPPLDGTAARAALAAYQRQAATPAPAAGGNGKLGAAIAGSAR